MINRRKFVSLNAAALCLAPLAGFSFPTGNNQMKALVKPTWLIDLIKLNDTYLNGPDANKIKDKLNPFSLNVINIDWDELSHEDLAQSLSTVIQSRIQRARASV
jgi:hypothetical protein